ncbi:MAG: Hint domain-containing protein [Pseudomonadota bacterium]
MPTIYFISERFLTGASPSNPDHGDGRQYVIDETIEFDVSTTLDSFVGEDDDGLFQDSDRGQTITDPGTTDFTIGEDFEAEYTVVVADSSGNEYTLYGLSVGPGFSIVPGFAFVGDPPPLGEPLTIVSSGEGPRGASAPIYDDLGTTICFTPGTGIATPNGLRPIETLAAGDMVCTKDHGARAISWAGASHLSAEQLATKPHLAPVRIEAGAFGPGCPARDLTVSPHHRLLLSDWRAELLFGSREVLASAVSLTNDGTIRRRPLGEGVTYHHICFETHEIVESDGLASESLQPSEHVLDALAEQSRAELLELFPELRTGTLSAFGPAARRVLSHAEATGLR